MTDEIWQHDVLEAIRRLVGAEQASKVAAEWDEHAARGKVEVTFLGPYSSGKSSLLRRLVVDGDGEIPDWLTVSARRETFELNAVDVGELTFTDAPGFAAGNALHDELAQDALALSEAFLLVVPPQLLTTNRELVSSIASGSYFFDEPRPGTDQVVIAVVAQADSMGIDPEDDIEGWRELAERKQSELVAQLEASAGVPLPNLQVHCVAADPYEEQARQPHPDKAAFDPHRTWDGIDVLTAALGALSERYEELRRSALIRYFHRVGLAVASQAQNVVDELEATAEELRARETEWEQQRERVEGVIGAAEADLCSTLVALAGELSDEVGGDEAESRRHMDERLTATLDRWAQRWDGQLDLVLGEATAQADDRLGRARARRTEEFLRSLTVQDDSSEAPQANSRIVGMLNEINGTLQRTAGKTMEIYAGLPIEKLLAKAPRPSSASKEAVSEASKKAVSTASKEAVSEASKDAAVDASERLVRKARTLAATLEVVDGVLAIATLVDAERRQSAADKERQRLRERARERINGNAEIAGRQIIEGTAGMPGWRSRADSALDVLRERLGLTNDAAAIDDLMEAVAANQQAIADLRGLLASGPS